jgi:hypothetical protein
MDVISTNTGGIEVVLVPVHHGTVMMQLKGKAIYIDPDTPRPYPDLPKADLIFLTRGGAFETLKKENTEVIVSPLTTRRTFGDVEAESLDTGLIFSMLGRRFYITGEAPARPVKNIDAAFVCMNETCAPDLGKALAEVDARIVFPYRHNRRNLSALKPRPNQEIRLRPWY